MLRNKKSIYQILYNEQHKVKAVKRIQTLFPKVLLIIWISHGIADYRRRLALRKLKINLKIWLSPIRGLKKCPYQWIGDIFKKKSYSENLVSVQFKICVFFFTLTIVYENLPDIVTQPEQEKKRVGKSLPVKNYKNMHQEDSYYPTFMSPV